MKRLSIAVLGLLLAAGCSSSTTSPSASTSNSSTVTFKATLTPTQENPPIANAESAGSGTATIDLVVAKDNNGNIVGAVVNFSSITMAGFPASTVVNIAHIHTGALGTNGPILVNTTITPGDVTLTSGSGSFSRSNIATLSTTDAQAIINTPAAFYFNVHTALNPGGVMRGQLVKQ